MFEEYKRITSVVVPYALFCSFLYLYFYWSYFGIQPFEIIGINEALAYSVPFMVLAAAMIVPVFILEVVSPSNYDHGDDKQQSNALRILFLVTVVLNSVIIGIAALDLRPNLAILMGLVCGILPGAVNLSYSPKLKKYISTRPGRTFVCLVISCLPAMSVVGAIESSKGILDANEYRYIQGVDIKGDKEKGKLIYIGRLSNYIFFRREGPKTTVMYQASDLTKLELHQFEKPAHNKGN